jgi:hypothetical protein
MIYQGSCHCGAVSFSVEAPDSLEVERCNCSICNKAGYLHLIVPAANFTLLTGQDALATYTFNTGVARHTFCANCGIKPFYTPRSNPEGIDVNVNCLDTRPRAMTIVEFDGRNWEQNAHTLAHKSQAAD